MTEMGSLLLSFSISLPKCEYLPLFEIRIFFEMMARIIDRICNEQQGVGEEIYTLRYQE